jgi:Ca-activated chloride channel family protein
MRFGSPQFFWFFLLLPLLVGFFIWAWQQKQAALARFASLALIKKLTQYTGTSRQILKWSFFSLGILFLILALVRPRFGIKMEMIERQGVDVFIALDVSQSMLAQDITPNRLERAKHEIAKFISLLKGDRIGIIIFAGESYVLCPLTLDYGAAQMFLDGVETNWMSLQGTALGAAIEQAAQYFKSKSRKHKVLVLLSDGEEHEGDPVAAAKAAAQEGVKVFTIGIGSEGGVPIPLQKSGDNIVYKKDNSGNLVMTRLNSVILEKIALEANGKYFHAGTDLDLTQIYMEISSMEKKDFGDSKLGVYEERYQLFLLLALLCFIIEFFIPERVKRKKEWKGRFEE